MTRNLHLGLAHCTIVVNFRENDEKIAAVPLLDVANLYLVEILHCCDATVETFVNKCYFPCLEIESVPRILAEP